MLKKRLGFDGLVVSDWNGIEQVPGCTKWHCPQAINAGIDLVMVPDDWKKFIGWTVADVRAGRIAVSRIDDAVSRIIRVKLNAGLFASSPATGPHPDESVLHSPPVRELAREAVRKSLVLLKNQGGVLPLRRTGRILVVGKGADNLPMQAGGWSLTWQGDKTTTADYPFADTLLSAMRKSLGADQVDYSADDRSSLNLAPFRCLARPLERALRVGFPEIGAWAEPIIFFAAGPGSRRPDPRVRNRSDSRLAGDSAPARRARHRR